MPIKKTRTDAWESRLSEDERQKLYLLTGSLSYNAAKAVAKSELKLDLPSHATFYRFLERMREEDAALRLAKATQVSREVTSMAKAADIADDDLIKSLQSLGAEAALQGNVKDATRLVMMACDLARKTAKSEELKFAREKFEYDAAKKAMDEAARIKTVTADDTLSTDEKIQKVREVLFG